MTTKTLTVADVIHAWTASVDKKLAENREAVQRSMYLTNHMLKLLSEGQPVTAERLAAQAELPLEEVETVLQQYREQGGEFDKAGRLVGAALTLNPTPHRFRVNSRELYTWCALDAVFLPGLLDKTAAVESVCPVTGESIHLTIAPEGVRAYSPASTVLSIAVPGLSCKTGDSARATTGPQSDACNQMHFFSSRAATEAWIVDHPGVAIFTVEEAYRLAYANWIARHENSSGKADELDNDLNIQDCGCCC